MVNFPFFYRIHHKNCSPFFTIFHHRPPPLSGPSHVITLSEANVDLPSVGKLLDKPATENTDNIENTESENNGTGSVTEIRLEEVR